MPRAGLATASVTEAGADLVDELGIAGLSMCRLAERLGVKTPSLHKHVGGQSDLVHRIAVLAATELGDALQEAVAGRPGSDALRAAAQAMRAYVTGHPGRYAAGQSQVPAGVADPLIPAIDRMLGAFAAVLRGYRLDPRQEVHALRMMRSVLHGFTVLEVDGSFRFSTDVDDSFDWMVDFIDRGLRSAAMAAVAR